MWGLLISTIITSAADCLNPIAITQQFVLQGLVKKPKHIWYFIIPTGVVNLITGFLAYYGVVTLLGGAWSYFTGRHSRLLFSFEMVLGVVFLVWAFYMIRKNKTRDIEEDDEEAVTQKIKSVSPVSLVILGIGSTIAELTSALPYFAFLAILLNYRLTAFQLTPILVLYNLIYMLPLMILYFIYVKAQDKFDYLYRIIKGQIKKWGNIAAPILVFLIGIALIIHSALFFAM